MSNHFTSGQPQYTNNDIFSQWNNFRSDPSQFLANRGINVPREYQNSPEQTAKYLLSQMNPNQQNAVMQTVNRLQQMFGFK